MQLPVCMHTCKVCSAMSHGVALGMPALLEAVNDNRFMHDYETGDGALRGA